MHRLWICLPPPVLREGRAERPMPGPNLAAI